MNRGIVTKRIIQGVAVAFGVLGLMWMFMGLGFAVTGFREPDYLMTLLGISMAVVLGGVLVAIAWANLRHFGSRSIRHVAALVVATIYLCFSSWLFQLMEWLERAKPMVGLLLVAMLWLSLYLMHRLYRALSCKLIQLAGLANGERGDPALLSDAPSDAPSERE
ncbi:hypothetical protein [Anaerobaca lacustris]|uniref:DUF3021 domain-containing protein n=1 Tax=Anaerobaca lacustris TaxID=3044600 RepID=A0AAW6TT98_9BACT|nr:hypothetical protein [Sedimentisphaerales bacterium M17dextr]